MRNVPGSVFENFAMHENFVSCENQSFFLSFSNVVPFIKSLFVFLYYFLPCDEVL